jgi:DNA-binding NarL/FixJ family response regulator
MAKLLVVDQCNTFFQNIEEGVRSFGEVECLHARNETEARELLGAVSFSNILVENFSLESNGIDFIRYLRNHFPDLASALMSESKDQALVYAAFAAGAQGFLLKPITTSDLLHHLRGWFMGIAPISPCIAAKLINRYCNSTDNLAKGTGDGECKMLAGFSKRECEVMSLMVSGTDTKGIASKLCVSNSTVATHIKNIYGKLRVNNRSAAVSAIIQADLANSAKKNAKSITNQQTTMQSVDNPGRRSTDL